jgi:hypothetical protein
MEVHKPLALGAKRCLRRLRQSEGIVPRGEAGELPVGLKLFEDEGGNAARTSNGRSAAETPSALRRPRPLPRLDSLKRHDVAQEPNAAEFDAAVPRRFGNVVAHGGFRRGLLEGGLDSGMKSRLIVFHG